MNNHKLTHVVSVLVVTKKMTEVFRKFLDKYFLIILTLLVVISFGQIILMQPWQDDNALMFKLSHIDEPVGFLGRGIFGEGPYRYTATPYYVFYRLFGYNISLFFGLALVCYLLATFSIYWLFKTLVDKNTGRLASVLFAANYATSDSFIRLFNSVSSSLGVVLLCGLIISYWKLLKSGRWQWYILALIIFWLSSELVFVRFHYLIAGVILFEVIFGLASLRVNTLVKSFLRVIPFFIIFRLVYLLNGDSRLSEAVGNIGLILSGKLENSWSLFTGLGQLIIPDKLLSIVSVIASKIIVNPYHQILAINGGLFLVFGWMVFRLSRSGKITKLGYVLISLVWLMVSRQIYLMLPPTTPYLSLLVGFVGGLVILAIIIYGLSQQNQTTKLCVFLLALAVANILSYIIYDPTLFIGVYNSRYLVHSYVGLIGVLAIIATQSKRKLIYVLILGWGSLNLFMNIVNQREIVNERSLPIANFHDQLRQAIVRVQLGGVLYFDLEDSPLIKVRFSDAISSSQMPETAAIAWRFGLDRYDFDLVTSFDDLRQVVKAKQIPTEKIYSFWYSKKGLVNTTDELRLVLKSGRGQESIQVNLPALSKLSLDKSMMRSVKQDDIVLDINNPISSVGPITLDLTIQAKRVDTSLFSYPYHRTDTDNVIVTYPLELRNTTLRYGRYKELSARNFSYTGSDEWSDRVVENIHDSDFGTVWQSDRTLWQKNPAVVSIDMHELLMIDSLFWVNGFADTTPVDYLIEGSEDSQDWRQLKRVTVRKRIDGGQIEVVKFEPQLVRFVRVTYLETFNNDSPAIAELMPVPAEYSQLDLNKTEYFLRDPFGYIPQQSVFDEELGLLNYQGKLRYFWWSDKSDRWLTENNSEIKVTYDGLPHHYTISIPAGGTKLTKIMLSNIQIPGDIVVTAIDENTD